MAENPKNIDLRATVNIATTSTKRHARHNRKNRSLGRRKSGGEKNKSGASRNVPIVVDHRSAGSSMLAHENPQTRLAHENPQTRLISLSGCCDGEAFQLLNDRWEAAMNAYCNPDLSANSAERPVMYSGSGESTCGHFKLPHQMISRPASVGASGLRMDFMSKLKVAMQNANP